MSSLGSFGSWASRITDWFLFGHILSSYTQTPLVMKTRFPVTVCVTFRYHVAIWNEQVSSLSHIFHTDGKPPCSLSLVLKGRLGNKKLQLGQKMYFPPIGLIGFWGEQRLGATVAAFPAAESKWTASNSQSVEAPRHADFISGGWINLPTGHGTGGKLGKVIAFSVSLRTSFWVAFKYSQKIFKFLIEKKLKRKPLLEIIFLRNQCK